MISRTATRRIKNSTCWLSYRGLMTACTSQSIANIAGCPRLAACRLEEQQNLQGLQPVDVGPDELRDVFGNRCLQRSSGDGVIVVAAVKGNWNP